MTGATPGQARDGAALTRVSHSPPRSVPLEPSEQNGPNGSNAANGTAHGTANGTNGTASRAEREIAVLRRENDRLRQTIDSRAVIEQAKGALILRYGLDDGAAFAVLSRWSQNSNVKLHTIADTLINVVCRRTPDRPGDRELAAWLEAQVHEPVSAFAHPPQQRSSRRA
jgi:ANTAR domain